MPAEERDTRIVHRRSPYERRWAEREAEVRREEQVASERQLKVLVAEIRRGEREASRETTKMSA